MKFRSIQLLIILLLPFALFPQNNPKHEMRGIWIASLGIDWPLSGRGTSAAVIQSQKNEYVALVEKHKLAGMNAMFFHVRPTCDAVYKSDIEPWSSYLTGTQGVAPSDPNYDPLTFAIEETHKRGMELHAWLNPYRAVLSGGSVNSLAATHVVKTHPEWIIKCNGSEYRFLNPGLPEVRAYVTNIIVDLLKRYDLDGIHFDDYFYPYTDYGSFNDDATFAKYPYGFTNRAAWRENNVHLLMKMIDDSVKYYKPWVKFGISPSGNPSVNTSIFVNSTPWLKGEYVDTLGVAQKVAPYVDYMLPQLYWVGFSGYLPIWASTSYLNGRHLYIGHAAYRFHEASWPATECGSQVLTSRGTPTSQGGVYFSSKSVTQNLAGCWDTLKHNYYANYAIVPSMPWLPGNNKKPNAPTNLRAELNSTSGKYELTWDKPSKAADGDTAFIYIVYRSETSTIDITKGNNIFGTTGQLVLSNAYARYSATKGDYYVVTCVDRYGNESALSNVYKLNPTGLAPEKPVLIAPANNNATQSSVTTLSWQKAAKAESYTVQVSTDPTFASDILLQFIEMEVTSCYFKGLRPGIKYYWRVKAHSFAESAYSDVYSFEAGYPMPPVLATPAHASVDVPLNPVFTWYKAAKATSYRFMLATSSTFNPASTVVKDTTITDTVLQVKNLALNKLHFWKVQAINQYGQSDWPTTVGFRTTNSTAVEENKGIVKDFCLMQNYPNPFNPSTQITYIVPKNSFVSVKVYDVLGNEIETLVNQGKPAGTYTITFPLYNRQLPSGVYFCKISAGNFSDMKKMVLIK